MGAGRKVGRADVVIAPDIGTREDQAGDDVTFRVLPESIPRVRAGVTSVICVSSARTVAVLVGSIKSLGEE